MEEWEAILRGTRLDNLAKRNMTLGNHKHCLQCRNSFFEEENEFFCKDCGGDDNNKMPQTNEDKK